MTKPYLNFESVVSNLAWLAGSGAVRLWQDRLSMRMSWDFFMLYLLHSSPSFLSAAELGLRIVSIQKGFVVSEGVINCT